MRILFLSPRQCWPARSGAKLREYYFLRALAQRADVTYLHFTDHGALPLTQKDLPFCREVLAVPKPSTYGRWKLLRGALGRWPLPILNYTSPEMSATAARLASSGYDLIHLDSIHMIRYATGPRIIFNWHNIESEAMRRYSATVESPARRWYAVRTAAKLERLERDILRTSLGHLVCSPRELDQLRAIDPKAPVAVIQNGVDMRYFENVGEAAAQSRDLVFVGSMDYYPNAEAALSFGRRIWPLVRQRMPGARLLIVGANPGPDVLALGEISGITVTGTVPDVRPYYRQALAAIVPLRTGGGTRLKILEAMAAGVPVVSTPLGAEGLNVIPGRHLLIADPDDAEAWAGQLQHLADDHACSRKALVAAALDLVRHHYDWEMIGQILWETYQGWLRSNG